MARPTVEMRNRASASASHSRRRQSPGLAVQAGLSVAAGPNPLEPLANALGVASQVVSNISADRQQQKLEEQQQLDVAKAEADSWGDTVDEERMKSSRVYRDRYRVIASQRKALEITEQLQADYEDFRTKNPLADEQELRTFLAERKTALMSDEYGDPMESLADPRVAAIIEGQFGAAAYRIISSDRDVFEKNVKEHGAAEASAAVLAVARQNKGLKVTDMEAMRTQLKAIGWDDASANKMVASAALAAAEELESPDPLRVLPDKWADGAAGPRSDPELARMADNQADVQQARNDAAANAALEGERLNWRLKAEDLAAQGKDLDQDLIAEGFRLGISAEGVASMFGKARSAREQAQREAERESRDAQRHAEQMAALQGNPWSVDRNQAEDALSIEFQNAPPGTHTALIRQWVRQRGILPGTYRNYLNRVPIEPDSMKNWSGGMKDLRDTDPGVYASLDSNARAMFEAYESVKATGRYSDEAAFQRVRNRKPDVGRQLVQSKLGKEAINAMLGSNPTPNARALAQQVVETFLSFEDLPQDEAIALAQRSFSATYFKHDGRVYHKGHARDPGFLDWAKTRFSQDLARRGVRVDPDDLVISPVGDGSTFTVVERGGITPLVTAPVSGDLLYRAYKGDEKDRSDRAAAGAAETARAKAAADQAAAALAEQEGRTGPTPAAEAARRRLNPYRRIPNEPGWKRVKRVSEENAERKRQGLPQVITSSDPL